MLNQENWIERIDHHPFRVLGLICLLALILNVGDFLIPPSAPLGDTSQWWELALNIAHGRGYVACYRWYFPLCGATNQVTVAREPLPALLFAGIALLIHEGVRTMAASQLLMNLLILLGIFFLARELGNVRAALLAALLWALYLPAIGTIEELGGDLLATLWVTWGLFLFLRALRTNGARYWVAAGVCIGFGVLSRSTVLVIAAALGAGLILWPNTAIHSLRARVANLRPLALFMIAGGLTLLPWAVRNYMAFGRVVISSSLVGYNLYRYNYSLPTDNYLRYVAGTEGATAISALVARRTDLQGTENEVQMDALYRDEAIRIIVANPLHYMLLSGYRFLFLWFNWGVKNAYAEGLHAVDYFLMIEQLVLLVAATIGLRGKWRQAWPLAVGVISLTFACMAVDARLRYILPAMPLTVSLASLAFTRVEQQWRRVPVTMLALSLLILIVVCAWSIASNWSLS